MLLYKQSKVSPDRGMPIEMTDVAKKLQSITNETVQLYYSNAGVITTDAGQLAGVSVIGKLTNSNALDAIGATLGKKGNTSLSFTSTALTTEIALADGLIEANDDKTIAERITNICSSLSNGQYVVDYRDGIIYGKKASNTVTLTGTSYKVNSLLITATA